MVQKEWSKGELLGTSSAYWRGCALQAAVRLGVFTALASSTKSSAEIAAELKTDLRATESLLHALTAMGLLSHQDGNFSNSTAAVQFLCKESKHYMGHIILHHHHILDGWAQLDTAVTTGNPVTMRSYGETIERESFLMGMFNLAMSIAPQVAAQIDLSGRRHLLDLGGGPGTYAIHFCLANPQLTATIYDRQTTEPFASATVNQFGLSERIGFAAGDFNQTSVTGGPYDVAWLSHILHSFGPDECQALIDKTVGSMQSGGLLMIHDFILNNTKDGPEFPALFSLNMLIHNAQGRSYSEAEIRTMLRTAGVKEIRRHPFQGPNDSAILCGILG